MGRTDMWKLPIINGKMYRKLAIKHTVNEGFDEIIQLNGGFFHGHVS